MFNKMILCNQGLPGGLLWAYRKCCIMWEKIYMEKSSGDCYTVEDGAGILLAARMYILCCETSDKAGII